jgi:Fe2+ or Zn2+ uptake regulation protein
MENITLERTTSQKKIILDYLKSVTTHPSANVVYIAVRKNLPHISRGTVYRVLNNLRKKGEIQAIQTKDATFFDGDVSDHAHFICTDCGKIYDVFDECSKCGILKKRKLKVGKIKNYKVQFYGTCKKCK